MNLVLSATNAISNSPVKKSVVEDLESHEPECQPTITVSASNSENTARKIFNVVYGKQSKKKHKTWEGDGTLEIHEKYAMLKDETGKAIGKIILFLLFIFVY